MQEQPQIPGLAEAIDQEQTRRQLAFDDTLLPIGGVWVKQFTPYHWVKLGIIRSPFLGGDRGSAFSTVSVLEFLWICSPAYRPASFWGQLCFYVKNYRRIKPVTANLILDYLEAAFMDRPGGRVGSAEMRSYYAGVTSICDYFAKEYGWDDAITMGKPIARLFQYYNCIRQRSESKPILFNPLSDRVRSQALHHRS
jgi:hypothetical protein